MNISVINVLIVYVCVYIFRFKYKNDKEYSFSNNIWVRWVMGVREMDTLWGEATLLKLFLPPFLKRVFSKRKEFTPFWEQILSFWNRPL